MDESWKNNNNKRTGRDGRKERRREHEEIIQQSAFRASPKLEAGALLAVRSQDVLIKLSLTRSHPARG